MAAKPRSEWSPAYRRRVERAEARGLSKQQARGHKPGEHITRAARARAEGKLTSAEKQWVKRQLERVGGTPNARWEAAVEAFTELSPEERDAIRAEQMLRQRSPAYAAITGRSFGDELSPMYLSNRSGLR